MGLEGRPDQGSHLQEVAPKYRIMVGVGEKNAETEQEQYALANK